MVKRSKRDRGAATSNASSSPDKKTSKNTSKDKPGAIAASEDIVMGKNSPSGKSPRQNSPEDYSDGQNPDVNFLMSHDFWMGPIKPSTERYRSFQNDAFRLKSFGPNEIFGEDKDCIHELLKTGKFRSKAKLEIRQVAQVTHFEEVFLQAVTRNSDIWKSDQGKILRRLALRLAKTDPVKLFVAGEWRGNNLIHSDVTAAWLAAYKLFGAPWKTRPTFLSSDQGSGELGSGEKSQEGDDDHVNETNTKQGPTGDLNGMDKGISVQGKSPGSSKYPSTDNSDKTKESGVHFHDTTRPVKLAPVFNKSFLSKPLKKTLNPKMTLMARLQRKYVHYFKFKLPKIKSHDGSEQVKQVCSDFEQAMDAIWEVDKKAVVIGWAPDSNANLLKMGRQLPTTKPGLRTYADRVYTSADRSPYLRLKIDHNVDPARFDMSSFVDKLRGRDSSIVIDKLQSQEIREVGQLLGAHPGVFNADNWSEAFAQYDALKDIPLEFRVQDMKVSKQSTNDYVRCVAVFAGRDKTPKARNALLDLTSSSSKSQLPLGLRVRFIPNVLDESFITTNAARRMARRARTKQKNFMSKTMVSTSHTIQGLDYIIEKFQVSLREAILAIPSRTHPDKHLFIMVEDDFGSTDVKFLYHESMADEAMTAIPALPLLLEKELDSTLVWTWFSNSAKDLCHGYVYDPARGVCSTAGDSVEEHLDDWILEGDDSDDEVFDEGTKVIAGNKGLDFGASRGNFYNDEGTISTLEFKKAKALNRIHENENPDSEPVDQPHPPDMEATIDTSATPSTLTTEMSPELLRQLLTDHTLRDIAKSILLANPPTEGVVGETS